MSETLALIGLGSMGYGMGQSLLRAGLSVYGADISAEPMARFQAEGGLSARPESVDTLVVTVLNAPQTEAVLFGDGGWITALRKGGAVISCATVAPSFARAMAARCAEAGVEYLDSPISGGAAKAADGALSIMASGSPAAFAGARVAFDAMAETVFDLGETPGAGSAMKAINQMLAGTHIAAMAEAVTFGMTQGVDPATTVDVISKCAGSSWMFENRAPHIVDGDYTPRSSINIWPKDLGIVLDIAAEAKFSAPMTAAALQQFMAAAGSGLGAEDDAAVAKVYARNSGLTLPGDS